jgi:hypothetical protein
MSVKNVLSVHLPVTSLVDITLDYLIQYRHAAVIDQMSAVFGYIKAHDSVCHSDEDEDGRVTYYPVACFVFTMKCFVKR